MDLASCRIILALFIFLIFSLTPGSCMIEFGAGAGHLFECASNGIHCIVKSRKVIAVIDIDRIVRQDLELMLEHSYATSNVKCYIPMPWSSGTASSLNGSMLHVTLMRTGSSDTLGNFSVPLLLIPAESKEKSCHGVEVSGQDHGVRLQATALYFDVEAISVINNTGDNGIYYHYKMPSPTENTVDVFINDRTIHRDANFQLYCTQRRRIITSTMCFLEFVDVSNIENGSMIKITMNNRQGQVLNEIYKSIIKPPAEVLGGSGSPYPDASNSTTVQSSTKPVQSSTEVQPSTRFQLSTEVPSSSTKSLHISLYFVITSISITSIRFVI